MDLAKKIAALVICAAMVLTAVPLSLAAEVGEGIYLMAASGAGTNEEPYVISSEEDLLELANATSSALLSANYILANDIEMTQLWVPIGVSTAFSGVFDGNGHSVTNVVLEGSGYENTGFFAQTSGTVKNLTIEVTFSGSGTMGGLAAVNTGTITNCFTSGTVTETGGNYSIGGLVGHNESTISNSGSTVTVVGGSGNTGGLIGYNYRSPVVTNCYAQGKVTGTGNTGGLVGRHYGTLTNCYASGTVNTGLGAGLIAYNNGAYYNSYYRSINEGNQIGYSVSVAQLRTQSTFYCWDFDNIWEMESGGYPVINVRGTTSVTYSGAGTDTNPYIIETEKQLQYLANNTVYMGTDVYFKLANDIAINTNYWTPIGIYTAFSGHFDGDGHTISGVNHTGADYDGVGLFSHNAGTIQNLTVSGTVSGAQTVGLLTGYNTGTITNCFTSGTVTETGGNYSIGGLVGHNESVISNSGSTAVVVGGSGNTGGLIGYNYRSPVVTNCYAQGKISGTGNTGGLIGRHYGKVINSYASGLVNDGVGAGLIGYNNGEYYNSYYRSTNEGNKTGYPVTVAELRKQDTYYQWDFDNIWEIGSGYPYINVRGETPEVAFEGDGDSDFPYLIENEEQLHALAMGNAVTGTKIWYQLVNDITLTAKFWTPIGKYTAFVGVFDGNGHTISGLNTSGTDFDGVGLFSHNEGTIQNLTVSGTASGGQTVGLLTGYNTGTITNCFTSGTVTETGGNYSIGGLVGHNESIISNSGSTVTVIGGSGNTGGLIGYNYRSPVVTNCYAQGNVTGTGNTGGLIGRHYGQVINSYASGLANDGVGAGLIGYNNGEYYNSYYNNSNSANKVGYPASDAMLKSKSTFYCWDFDNIWEINGSYPYINVRGETPEVEFEGEGDVDFPYMIENEEQLHALAMGYGRRGEKVWYQLANDITLTARFWTPIGKYTAFVGIFDGNDHTISGLNTSGTDFDGVGLFSHNEGTIQNLKVSGTVSGGQTVGMLTGYNTGTITNCFTSGTVTEKGGNYSIGGLVGHNESVISQSGSIVTVIGGSGNTGGLIGYNYRSPSITDCYAKGDVSGTGNTGGLVGRHYGTLTNCYATGLITATGTTGGLVGYNNGTVISSYYDTETTGQSDTTKGTPISDAEMKTQTTFSDWDFVDIWGISSSVNDGYPYLLANAPEEEVAVTGITLSSNALSTSVGKTETITASVLPANATDKSVTWQSTDESVATVEDGIVTALSVGTTVIIATAGSYTATCTVSVEAAEIAVTGISLSNSALSLEEGGTATLTATVAPADATDKSVTWQSSDESVATVTNGVVTAVSAGTTVIIATAGSCSAVCTVTVTAKSTPTVEVTGITLSSSSLTMAVGESDTLIAVIEPSDATDKTVTWISSNTGIATVENGVVTAVSAGTAVIIATASGKTAICTVTVTEKSIAVESVMLSSNAITITKGESATITASVTPDNATDKTVTWKSSETSVATVENGVVTAVAAGITEITATAGDYTVSCVVTVTDEVAVESVKLNASSMTISVNTYKMLTATVNPSNATNANIVWQSSDESIATVKDGKVVGISAGTVKITAAAGTVSASCVVTVSSISSSPSILELTMSASMAMTAGESKYISNTYTYGGDSSTVPITVWTSSDESVATVAENGLVTALKAGTATITLSVKGKNTLTAACRVTVTEPENAVITVGTIETFAGETVTVPIAIAKNPGIAGFNFRIMYDTSLLEPVSIAKGSALSGGTLTSNIQQGGSMNSYNYVTASWIDTVNFTDNGVILNVTFKVAADAPDGDIPISITYEGGNILNASYEDVEIEAVSGAVSVETAMPGDVYADNLVNQRDGVRLMQYLADTGVELTAKEKKAADVTGDGNVNTKDGVRLMQYLADWDVELMELFSVDDFVTLAGDTLTFKVDSVEGAAGEYVDVPVYITENPGVAGFKLALNYDTTKLTAVSITAGDALSEGTLTSNLSGGDVDYVTASWINTSNVTATGVAFTVRFKVADDVTGKTALTLTYSGDEICDQNLDEVSVSVVEGAVTVGDAEDESDYTIESIETEQTADGLNVKVSVTKNASRAAADRVIIAEYADDALVDVEIVEMSDMEQGETRGFEAVLEYVEGAEVKAFVWNENGMAPLN